MSTLGAGVIGLGVGERHVQGYLNAPGSDVVALCDLSEETLTAASAKYSPSQTTTDWREVTANDDVHVVSIASFDDVHCEQVVASLKSEKHVFVEKPMCRSWDELKQVKQALDSRELHLSSNMVLRAAPVYQWLRKAIRQGDFGEIYAFDGDYLFGRLHKITEGWRKDVRGGYSVMLGGGIHLVDLMLWLTGERPTSVAACGNTICTRDTSFGERDFVSATFLFPSGLVGRITANFGCVHRHQHVVRVFGTKATFVLDDQGPRMMSTRDPDAPPQQIELATVPADKWALIPQFVDDLHSSRDGRERSQREFDTVSVCLAADESLHKSTQMEVSYV